MSEYVVRQLWPGDPTKPVVRTNHVLGAIDLVLNRSDDFDAYHSEFGEIAPPDRQILADSVAIGYKVLIRFKDADGNPELYSIERTRE